MIRVVFCSLALLGLATPSASIAKNQASKPLSNLVATVNLYLSADAAYRPGDLLTQSHLEEIQVYLRRTQGNSTATHSKWRQRMLPDSAPLVKLFYSGGGPILRKAAVKLDGYAKLDRLSRSGSGRKLLQRAIDRKSPAELIEFLTAERAKSAVQQPKQEIKPIAAARPERIYTAADFFAAIAAPLPTPPRTKDRATISVDKQAR